MSKISLFNLGFGFLIITVVAMTGSFLATDMADFYHNDVEALNSWAHTVQKSAHGHCNLFGIIQILFGLTLNYSKLSVKIKKLQTAGLILGVVAMGPLMLIRASLGPPIGIDLNGILIGSLLSTSFLSLGSHSFALFSRFFKES